jgi:hypothetical protein
MTSKMDITNAVITILYLLLAAAGFCALKYGARIAWVGWIVLLPWSLMWSPHGPERQP